MAKTENNNIRMATTMDAPPIDANMRLYVALQFYTRKDI